jgi:hypothetical protein
MADALGHRRVMNARLLIEFATRSRPLPVGSSDLAGLEGHQ